MSLLMASVLVTAPLSALNLPEQPVIEPDNQVQESTQKNLSEVVPPVEITPPEFVQPDISTSIVAKAKYENILKKSREKIQFISSSNSPESKNTQPLPDEADKNYSHPPIPPSPHLPISQSPQTADSDDPMSQVNSVSQLEDVQPADWAFGALQSLVERYGCIAGYADGTYLGNRSITRYEFAAGLNACLEKINEAITNNKLNTVNDEDLILLQRLQDEFKAELQQLQQRVEVLENRTSELQANQFSTTTRLFGQAVFSVQGSNTTDADLFPRDGIPERQGKTNLTFTSSAQLTLATSFTGRDLLLTGLSAGNLGSNASLLSTNMGRLGFESNTDNNLVISDLSYRFLAADNLGIVVGTAGVNPINTFRGISPLEGSSDGAISLFGQRNPILGIGNGTGGIGFDWQISDRISLQGVYSAEIPSFPGNINQGGLFGGRFTTGAQLSLAPTNNLDIGIHYLYSHSPDGLLGTGIGDSQLISPFADATAFNTHAVGATVAWRINPNLQVGGWGGFTSSKPSNLSGSVETTNWMVFAAFPNLLRRGNLGGVLVGQPPKITSSTLPDGFNLPNFSDGGTAGGRTDTSIHLELFYRAQLSDNIALTPGLFVIFNPDHNTANDALVVGALRATFRF
ncbi:S-layer protein [Nostoc linckia z7]|uniref:S-layer protein n=3 Tax=Nostoc linckia TaxID=92942 RepID=A0ABX4KIZ8_NOSLI|nr:iron uptake porin [Nostoc linckia]PHJ62588.1 S-layer protein [Nostoc linckia z1]PHJ72024.1 S-layer protein [Nostoc linckia z3]PHJ84770.1 S-layer protein [Nostoc linckia z4]PHJ89798.1 S-layer protein [Nostoc linckia z6]PHJ93395.1 S-layer protein [Nostoc linckia z7]PHK26072.1 S-layer protein [Nostoc linckia z13]